jgi:UDP-glucose 6-dehydrogenase
MGSAEPGTAAAAFVELLKAKGSKVSRYDPDCSSAEHSDGESVKKTLNETVEGTDCIVILSGQDSLKRLNLKKLRAVMKSPAAIVDLVGAVEPEKTAGFSYRGLGRGAWKK